MPIRECDIPTINGRVYHLGLYGEELAADIILVGDPSRARLLADRFMEGIEINKENRGLRTVTGRLKGTQQRVSVVTSGMGTGSLEIVLNEIVALLEIDLTKREPINGASKQAVNLIRLGTSGALCSDTALGVPIIAAYAVGLDNAGYFWQVEYADDFVAELEKRVNAALETRLISNSRFRGQLHVYASKANPMVVRALEKSAAQLSIRAITGITASAAGFFAAQGRNFLRVRSSIPDLDFVLGDLQTGTNLRIENMEMESSFLFHFAQGLGYRAGTICVPIDNRRHDSFDADYSAHMEVAAKVAFKALELLRADSNT